MSMHGSTMCSAEQTVTHSNLLVGYFRSDTFMQLVCDRGYKVLLLQNNLWLQTVSKCDVGVKRMRRSAEVYAEHLAKGASHIQINMKLAQVKLVSGDIYTIRPAEKHSTCAVNSYKTSLWHLVGTRKLVCEVITSQIKAVISFWMFFTVIMGTLMMLKLFLFLLASQALLL